MSKLFLKRVPRHFWT